MNIFFNFKLGDANLNIYDGGSNKENINTGISFLSGNLAPADPVKSLGNQIFITFDASHQEDGKGFTAKITFGN